MVAIACALLAVQTQSGALDLGPVHVRVLAIGDLIHKASPVWDPSGRKLTPQEIKTIKGMPDDKSSEFEQSWLRNETDIGRFVVLQQEEPEGWRVIEDSQDKTILGSSSNGSAVVRLSMSLPKGSTSFRIPFIALNRGAGKTLNEFTDGVHATYRGIPVTVTSHPFAQVRYTKPKGKIVEERIPLTQFLVTLIAPKAWAERYLDLETPGIVWPRPRSKNDFMGPQYMHGIIDESPAGPDKLRITLTIAVPGSKPKNQTIRLVGRQLLRGEIKGLPISPH